MEGVITALPTSREYPESLYFVTMHSEFFDGVFILNSEQVKSPEFMNSAYMNTNIYQKARV